MFQFFIEINEKIILILFLYGILMGFLRKQFMQRILYHGKNKFLVNALNLVGTPVHEFGHFFFALLFGMQVTEVCFYRTLKQATDGRLGYVSVRQRSGGIIRMILNAIGSFFVGIGPLLMGPFVMILCYKIMPFHIQTFILSMKKPYQIFDTLKIFDAKDWILLVLFLYLLIGISMNLELSNADLKMAWKGFLFIEVLIFISSMIIFYTKITVSMILLNEISSYLFLIAAIGIAGAFIGVIFSLCFSKTN